MIDRKNRNRRANWAFCFVATAGVMFATAPAAKAQPYYWDGGTTSIAGNGNGASAGGTGNWSTAIANWDNGAVPHVTWPGTTNTAVFGGTAGTVTLTTPISVGGLRFDTTGYIITADATNTLTFAATNNTILFNGIAAATINGTVTGAGNVTLTAANPGTAGILTFSGVSTGGWSGTTTINTGMTLTTTTTSGNNNQVLNSTSGITINGGTIQFNRATNAQLNAISDTATIGVNGGGTFSATSADAGGTSANETIGAVTVNSGQMNFNWTNGASSGAQMILSGLTISSTAAVTFSGTLGSTGRWNVTGAGTTTAGQIIGPGVTTGAANGVAAQNDYAVYASNFVAAANIGASAQSTWSTTYAAGSNYTLNNNGVTAPANGRLTSSRIINSLRALTGTVAPTSVDATTDFITMANGLSNGDVVVSRNSTGGVLVQGRPYYVINASSTAFQVSATPGGAAVDLTATTVGFVGAGLNLNGNVLGTTGILNGSSDPFVIGNSGGGSVTLPTTTSGNLFVTNGNASVWIDAPITNNGAGVLTIVKGGTSGNGSGNVTLSGANTFTGGIVVNAGTLAITNNAGNTFTGGITINGGTLQPTTDAGLGDATQTITFGAGNGTLNYSSYGSGNSSPRTAAIILPAGSVGALQTSFQFGGIVAAPITGSGTLALQDTGGSAGSLNLTSTSSTFTGSIIVRPTAGGLTVPMASLGNGGAGTFLQLGGGTATVAAGFTYSGSTALSGRQLILGGGASSPVFNSSGSGAVTFSQDLGFAGTGAKTLSLGGTNTGSNTFSGNITNNSIDATATSLTKSGAGTWNISGNMSQTGGLNVSTTSGSTLNLSGTNTYSGTTINVFSNPATGTLTFQGIQALSNSTSLQQTHVGGTGGFGTIRILDDSASPAVRTGVNLTMISSNTSHQMTLFVGNNNTANGGTSSGTTTGSTISLGNLNFTQSVVGNTSQQLNITGANSYRLQINNMNLPALSGNWAGVLTPTSAPLTVAGTVRQTAGSTAGTMTLQLDGTASGNLITGSILDSLDGSPRALNLTKNNTAATWTLSGANAYTGVTLISGGTLIGIGGNAFGSTSVINMTGGNAPILSLRGDSSTSFVKASDSTPYTVTPTSSGATINVDQATVAGTGAKTMTIGALTTTSTTATYAMSFTGANSTSLTLGPVTGPASVAVATVTWTNNISSPGILTIPNYTSANTTGGETVTFAGTGNTTVTGAITPSLTALALTKSGAGTLTLNGTSSYTGVTSITGGTLSVNTLADGLSNSSIGASAVAAANLLIGNGTTLQYTGSGSSSNRQFTHAGTAAGHTITLNASGSGALNLTSTANIAYTNANQGRVLILDGTNTGGNTLAAALVNNGTAALSVVKNGPGTWSLTGTNTYTVIGGFGTTTVNNGTLLINGNGTGATGAVTVGGATATVASTPTLGGTGTIGGAVTIATAGGGAAGTLSPGNSPGTLNVNNNVTFEPGTTFKWEISGTVSGGSTSLVANGSSSGTSQDLLNITGTSKTLLAPTGPVTFDVSQFGGIVTLDPTMNYSFLVATTTASPNITGFGSTVSTTNATGTGSFADYAATSGNSLSLVVAGNNIYLNATATPEPGTVLAFSVGLLGLAGYLGRRRAFNSANPNPDQASQGFSR